MPLANVNSPRGFTPVRRKSDDPKRVFRPVAASRTKDLMVGDGYTVGADGNALRVVAATDKLHGVVEGIDLRPIATSTKGPVSQDYIPATDAGGIIGIEDPQAEFYVQAATFTTATDATKTAAIADADGDRPLRQSRQSIVLDATNKQLQIIELLASPADNADGAFAKVVVRLLQTL